MTPEELADLGEPYFALPAKTFEERVARGRLALWGIRNGTWKPPDGWDDQPPANEDR